MPPLNATLVIYDITIVTECSWHVLYVDQILSNSLNPGLRLFRNVILILAESAKCHNFFSKVL